jgi:hypothetical protein
MNRAKQFTVGSHLQISKVPNYLKKPPCYFKVYPAPGSFLFDPQDLRICYF